MLNSKKVEEVLTRGIEKIYPSRQSLEKLLASGKKLRVYQGFDPSMPNLHLGNYVGLLKLKQFQDLGHEVIFLVGDFTGMIGDPSGKSETRKALTRKQVLLNAINYKKQASMLLNFKGKNPAKILYNSKWLAKLSFAEGMRLTSLTTYAQVIERDMFQKRIKEGKDLFLNELLYPLMQGYDSVVMDVNLEIGGSDQTFNMLMGRTLMKKISGKEKFVLTTKLLVDKEGNKVGKTTGNALFLNSTPENFYGGIMSFPDEVIGLSFELLTEVTLAGIKEKIASDPMREKKRLAFEIIKLLWGEASAAKAQEEFEKQFERREVPQNVEWTQVIEKGEWTISKMLPQAIPTFAGSATISASKRIIEQGGLEFEGQKINDPHKKVFIQGNELIKLGRRFYKVKTK